jgi:hypothetical protein
MPLLILSFAVAVTLKMETAMFAETGQFDTA